MTDKNKDMIILKSNILRPGEKFIITDKSTDGKFLPGSTGFISFVKGFDQQFINVAHFMVVMTKKGKTGKERIEMGDLSAPIFEVDLPDDKFTMPGPDRKFFTRIEHITNNTDNVKEMDIYDLMGWVFSRTRFLHKLHSKTQYIKVWPNSNALATAMELPSHFSDNASRTTEYYTRPDVIDELVTVLGKTEARMAKCSIDYMHKTASLELEAIRNLFNFYASKGVTSEIMNVIHDTATYYTAKTDILYKLSRAQAGSKLFTDKTKAEVVTILNAVSH